MTGKLRDIEASYSHIAGSYAEHFFDELRHKPFDRALLDVFADQVRPRSDGMGGPVLDVGCGPGQSARALRERGIDVTGLDLAPEMIAEAKRRLPDIPFRVGSMLALDDAPASYAGLVAFYAIVHFNREELTQACREFFRVLRPSGLALASFHLGNEVVHRNELFGKPVNLDFVCFERATVEGAFVAAGFRIEAYLERAPHTEIEHPTQRGYILARKPYSAG
ncbi:class I SAM-dependent methyltransferase [Pendulispora rubella]|uniref:Class I SAM-dependent methyltransferase n=1 Tax=Pendulispora rubella TaxID=2741070 RepID=A0ABZ2KQ17_9BACT